MASWLSKALSGVPFWIDLGAGGILGGRNFISPAVVIRNDGGQAIDQAALAELPLRILTNSSAVDQASSPGTFRTVKASCLTIIMGSAGKVNKVSFSSTGDRVLMTGTQSPRVR